MGSHEKNRTYNFFFRHLLSQGGRNSIQNPFLARLDIFVLLTSWMITVRGPLFLFSPNQDPYLSSLLTYILSGPAFFIHTLYFYFSPPHISDAAHDSDIRIQQLFILIIGWVCPLLLLLFISTSLDFCPPTSPPSHTTAYII